MRRIKASTKLETAPPPPPPAPPPAPSIDVTPLADATAALHASVQALNDQAASLAALVAKGRDGGVRVAIERDKKGNMTALVIERVKPKGH